jgi:hypothetical protein
MESFVFNLFGNGWYFNAAKDPCTHTEWASYDCFDTIYIESYYQEYLKSG